MSRSLKLTLALASTLALPAHAGDIPDQAIKDADAGYYRKALVVVAPLAKDKPQDAEVQYRYGQALTGLNKADEAIAALKLAVSLDPKNGLYHRALGDAYALKVKQGMADGSAGMFSMMGMMKDAKAEWLAALELAPTDVNAHVDLAMYYIMVPGIMGGSYSKAHDLEDQLDKLDPVQALQVRANEAGNKDKDDEAVKLLQQAIEQDKTQGSRLALGLFYIGAKRYDDAFATFHEMTKDPKAYMAWYQIGKTSGLAKSNYDEGIASLKQYLAFEDLPDTVPSAAWAHYRLGNIYQAQGHKDDARNEYKTAADLNTSGNNDPDLASKLSKVQAELK